MRATLSLIKREFSAYFLSPIAYVTLTVFLVVTGIWFFQTVNQLTTTGPRGVEFPMQFMVSHWAFWLVYLFIPALLTMRLFAEERSTGTLEMLMTAPLRDWQVVLSKFIACFGFYLILWLPTLLYLPILVDIHPVWNPAWTIYSILMVSGLGAVVLAVIIGILGLGQVGRVLALVLFLLGLIAAGIGAWVHYTKDATHLLMIYNGIDPMPVLATYLGLILAGAMFLALGLWISSLVKSQIVAALISIFVSLAFMAGMWVTNLSPTDFLSKLLLFFTVPLHFSRDFSRGIVDSRHLVLYGSVALFCLFMTIRSLESRRWR